MLRVQARTACGVRCYATEPWAQIKAARKFPLGQHGPPRKEGPGLHRAPRPPSKGQGEALGATGPCDVRLTPLGLEVSSLAIDERRGPDPVPGRGLHPTAVTKRELNPFLVLPTPFPALSFACRNLARA